MSAHEDESAGQDTSKTDDGAVSTAEADDDNTREGDDDTPRRSPNRTKGPKRRPKR